MLTKTKIAFAALALLSLAGVSAASASDNNSGDYHGGFVMSGSMDGVNPAFHPDLFPSHANRSGHTNGRDAYASTTRSKADRVEGHNAFGPAGEGGAAGYNGTFTNGNFIPRGTSAAQVPAYREED
jgi:hypothetical protein